MKKLSVIVLGISALACVHNPTIAMQPAVPPASEPLIRAEGQLIPREFTINAQLIPANYTLALSPNTLFSLVGFLVACLGSGLVYHGAHKLAESTPVTAQIDLTSSPTNETTQAATQGKWLIGQGTALIVAGTLAIFHKSIYKS